ncbi:integrating conjugative element protein (TIGR03749 family) [Erwinia toletana]|uniref:Integrating conjugative element protein (TIGR03749 family) n=1 Tax=Winslowiella toletana TaxID=92490 RepID=A0ABS4PDK6_9GAMM|nr:TIGR03749 family integrating conjugative element protein [Winslowiella toletana]MBP2170715.1 integrating conjugative element protein (TIGR03749 family) [Winslowiella toletana]
MKIVILFALLISTPVFATEILQWERVPIPVALVTGQERLIQTDRQFKVGYPASLDGKLRIQSADGMLYLLASKSFPSARLQLRDINNGELVLLDISASDKQQSLEPLRLVFTSTAGSTASPPSSSSSAEPLVVLLVRYAAQSLYAPLRTVESLPGVSMIPPHLPHTVTTLLPNMPVRTSPLMAWRVDSTTVTAVLLKNQSVCRLVVDPRDLQGQFYAAAFQHDTLEPAGSDGDTTVVYLVTQHGDLSQAILPEPTGTREVKP